MDFSAQALTEAREQAMRMGASNVSFRVGELTATGLPDASAEAVLCTDAIQFPDEPASAYKEIRRVLKPGGRVALTCWNRWTTMMSGWLARERAMWEETVTLDPGNDPALRSLHAERLKSLQWTTLLRRILAVATNPQ